MYRQIHAAMLLAACKLLLETATTPRILPRLLTYASSHIIAVTQCTGASGLGTELIKAQARI